MKAVATKKQATEKKTKVTAKPKKAVAKNGHKPVNKMQMVEDMLLTKKGVTREEMSEASGWPYVNLNVALERVRKTHPKAKLENTNGRFRFVSP